MNKEQVEKHGEVIKWFVDNPEKGVWCYGDFMGNLTWFKADDPQWHLTKKYVQNDEYAELRMAQADGKTIMINGQNIHKSYTNNIDICRIEDLWKWDSCIYSIKPNKPKFKVGDWAIYDNQPEYEVGQWSTKSIATEHHFLWQPKEGEWCVFWDSGNSYHVEQFSHKEKDMYWSCNEDYAPNIAPLEFIQTLSNEP